MKKIIIISLLLITTSLYSKETVKKVPTAFSISAGTEYLDGFFTNFGFSVTTPIGTTKELDLKVALNMRTEKDGEETIPMINIPIKLGINFLFPIDNKFTFLMGTGLSPTIILTDSNPGFLMGPNIKAGLRLKVHPSMSLFLEATQSLLIGPPAWMYPSTEIVLGVHFVI